MPGGLRVLPEVFGFKAHVLDSYVFLQVASIGKPLVAQPATVFSDLLVNSFDVSGQVEWALEGFPALFAVFTPERGRSPGGLAHVLVLLRVLLLLVQLLVDCVNVTFEVMGHYELQLAELTKQLFPLFKAGRVFVLHVHL